MTLEDCSSTAAALAALTASPALAQDLTAVSFGGAYGAAQKKHMIDPFMKKTGTNVLFEDYSGGIAEIKAQVEAGNVQWDVGRHRGDRPRARLL